MVLRDIYVTTLFLFALLCRMRCLGLLIVGQLPRTVTQTPHEPRVNHVSSRIPEIAKCGSVVTSLFLYRHLVSLAFFLLLGIRPVCKVV